MSKLKVHKINKTFTGWAATNCGNYYSQKIAFRWNKVTCLACLKTKKKK